MRAFFQFFQFFRSKINDFRVEILPKRLKKLKKLKKSTPPSPTHPGWLKRPNQASQRAIQSASGWPIGWLARRLYGLRLLVDWLGWLTGERGFLNVFNWRSRSRSTGGGTCSTHIHLIRRVSIKSMIDIDRNANNGSASRHSHSRLPPHPHSRGQVSQTLLPAI